MLNYVVLILTALPEPPTLVGVDDEVGNEIHQCRCTIRCHSAPDFVVSPDLYTQIHHRQERPRETGPESRADDCEMGVEDWEIAR